MEPRILLLKVEETENVDISPVAADAVEVSDYSIERYQGNSISRNLERQKNGNQEQVNTSPFVQFGFKVEAAGSGAAATPAAYAAALRACGLDQTIDATNNKVVYSRSPGDQDSATAYDFDPETGLHQVITGARGNLKLAAGKGQIPKFEFSNFKGSYSDPVDGAPPGGINWGAWEAAGAFVSANVPVFEIDGYAVGVEQFSIDWGNNIPWIDVPNYKSSRITDRKPTASFTVIAPKIADKNYFQKLKSHSGVVQVPFALQLGTEAGSIVDTSVTGMQINSISEGESEMQRIYTINANIISDIYLATR